MIARDCCNVWRVWTASGPWCPGLTPLTQQFLQWEQRPSLLLLVTSKWQSKYFSSLDAGQYEPATSQVQSTFPLKTFYSNKTWVKQTSVSRPGERNQSLTQTKIKIFWNKCFFSNWNLWMRIQSSSVQKKQLCWQTFIIVIFLALICSHYNVEWSFSSFKKSSIFRS